jgi:hypothetical protein
MAARPRESALCQRPRIRSWRTAARRQRHGHMDRIQTLVVGGARLGDKGPIAIPGRHGLQPAGSSNRRE